MKIGIIGCIDYPNHRTVQQHISNLQFMYRPFGNMDDEYEEPITIVTVLKHNLDATAAIQASRSNFKVEGVEHIADLIKESDMIHVFRNTNCKHILKIINLILEANKTFNVMYPKEEEDNG